MAEIATYRCSNTRCLYTVRLSSGIGGRVELVCLSCRTVTAQSYERPCEACGAELFEEPLSRACPRCKAGALTLPHISELR